MRGEVESRSEGRYTLAHLQLQNYKHHDRLSCNVLKKKIKAVWGYSPELYEAIEKQGKHRTGARHDNRRTKGKLQLTVSS